MTSATTKYCGPILRVAVPTPLRRSFDYLPPKDADTAAAQIEPGCRVMVPFGNRKVVGLLLEVSSKSELSMDKLKTAYAVLDTEPLLTPALFKLLRWAASYYQHPIGEVFATALPAKLRTGKLLLEQIEVWKAGGAISATTADSLGRAFKQKALLEHIVAQGEVTSEQCDASGFSKRLLLQLEEKRLIVRHTKASAVAPVLPPRQATQGHSLKLNPEQQVAVTSICQATGSYSCFLLDGVTGSGKTEVYMRVMQQQLAAGRQCLVLVPEIGLTPQTVARFEARFSCRVAALHSGLNDTERFEAWRAARDGSAGIIIGTRSAVFTPLARPGLIVVDEEHDPSFKQQDGFRYSARDIAVMRAREENVCVILGSATPSLESLHNARNNKFEYLQLEQRTGSAPPPAMQVIDISECSLQSGFSEQLLFKIGQHLAQENQVLVFLNRRGFAPILQCQNCGWISECDNCVAQHTVHANPPGIRCHHCGAARRLPEFCPHCSSKELTTIGLGTQKIEIFLNRHFADSSVLRIDRDSTRSKRKLAEMLQQIQGGEPCILLGTQMLAKGHHFPNITLVAIVDADAGLFSADFRGQEHMAQTIIQVAGRAGRAERSGEVIIQSRHSSHATLQSIAQGRYSAFAQLLFAERQATAMPPYSHLCLIKAEATDMAIPMSFLRRASSLCRELCKQHRLAVEQLGPVVAPMEKRAGRFRVHLLLKSPTRTELQKLLTQLIGRLDAIKTPRKLRWNMDIDPQDLI